MHYPIVPSIGPLLVNHTKRRYAINPDCCFLFKRLDRDQLVLEFKGLPSGHIDGTTTVRATLLLVLFFGESFAASDR